MVEIRSISHFGLSVVTVVLREDVDTYLTRQLVAEKLSTVRGELAGSAGQPRMAPITTRVVRRGAYFLNAELTRGQGTRD